MLINGLGLVMENIEEYLKFQVDLEQCGIMFGVGFFWVDDEYIWNGEGMVIIWVDSLDYVCQIVDMDLMYFLGVCSFIVWLWLLNEGCIMVEVNFLIGWYVVS